MPIPKPPAPTADDALAHIRQVLAGGTTLERVYLEKLVAGYAKQQALLSKRDERARELDDEETQQLVLLAAGALARLDPADSCDHARRTLDLIRRDVATRRKN